MPLMTITMNIKDIMFPTIMRNIKKSIIVQTTTMITMTIILTTTLNMNKITITINPQSTAPREMRLKTKTARGQSLSSIKQLK